MQKSLLWWAILVLTFIGGAALASNDAVTICAAISTDNSYQLTSLSIEPYLNGEKLSSNLYMSDENCITFSQAVWSQLTEWDYDTYFAIRWHDKGGGGHLLEKRDIIMFDSLYTQKKLTLYYDIFVVPGQHDDFLLGSVAKETYTGIWGYEGSSRKYGSYRKDRAIIAPINVLHTIWATKYNNPDSFQPDWYLTREQAAKFFVQTAYALGTLSGNGNYNLFLDEKEIDSTLLAYVHEAVRMGIMKGYNSRFYPKKVITLAEAVTVLMRMHSGVKGETLSPWYKNYFNTAYHEELFADFAYNPHLLLDWNLSIKRGLIGLMIMRLLEINNVDLPNNYGI